MATNHLEGPTDATDAGTNVAIVSGAMATFDAELYIDAWDGSTWQEVTQLSDDSGNATFSADWHTQFNRIYIGVDERRLRIENVDSSAGWTAVEGDER